MSFEEFKDGHPGSHLGYRNGRILAILTLQCLPSSFGSIWLMVWEEMLFEEFQDGHRGDNLGYQNETILAILNLCGTVMSPNRFWLNPTYGLGGDVVSRLPPWRPSWISERNDFSNFEYLCHCDASHQVSAQSDLRFGRRCCLKNFQMAAMRHLGYRNGWILAILNLCVTVMPPIKFQLNRTYGLGGDVDWRISRWPSWRPSWILEQNDLAIVNLCVTMMPPIKFWLNPTYGLGGDIFWRISRWLPWRPSFISQRNDFSNSESLYHCDVSYQVLTPSDLRFGRCRLKTFKIAATASILDIGMERF